MRALMVCSVLLMFTVSLAAQQPATPTPEKSISSHLGLHSFPAKNQAAAQQKEDERNCYNWAKQDSGYDPVAAMSAQQASTPPPATTPPPPNTRGAGAKGAAAGAARGAVAGAIAGDAGKGAEAGAAVGAMKGRSRARRAEAQYEKQTEQQQQQQAQKQAQAKAQNQKQLDSFKKGFSACMEAKGYVVK